MQFLQSFMLLVKNIIIFYETSAFPRILFFEITLPHLRTTSLAIIHSTSSNSFPLVPVL